MRSGAGVPEESELYYAHFPSRAALVALKTATLSLFLAGFASAVKCGNPWLLGGNADSMRAKAARKTSKSSITDIPYARTLESAHFFIHYALLGDHQVLLQEGEEALARTADSIRQGLPSGAAGRSKDSSAYAVLDSLKREHPAYVRKLAAYLEAAWGYYVDTLGMEGPLGTGVSHFFRIEPGRNHKYPVEIVDIGNAEPDARSIPLYGLAFPIRKIAGLLIENDFLYLASMGPDRKPAGMPIVSRVGGRLSHDYHIEWDAGLKVTASHEFYHAVQFHYVPDFEAPHIWYEVSASGMEERLAPEVDDYLQYLPALFEALPNTEMFDYTGDPEYGNGIFHVFMGGDLDERFDVKVWSRLRDNGNDIREALEWACRRYGRSAGEEFSRYAYKLAMTRLDPAPDASQAFSPDASRWPRLNTTEIDPANPLFEWSSIQRPWTLRVLRMGRGGDWRASRMVFSDTTLACFFALPSGPPTFADIRFGAVIPLPGTETGPFFTVLANTSASSWVKAELRRDGSLADPVLRAYPNPVSVSRGPRQVLFSRQTESKRITIYNEWGLEAAALDFSKDSLLWSWDLSDADGVRLKPGVFYYREEGGPLKTLLLK